MITYSVSDVYADPTYVHSNFHLFNQSTISLSEREVKELLLILQRKHREKEARILNTMGMSSESDLTNLFSTNGIDWNSISQTAIRNANPKETNYNAQEFFSSAIAGRDAIARSLKQGISETTAQSIQGNLDQYRQASKGQSFAETALASLTKGLHDFFYKSSKLAIDAVRKYFSGGTTTAPTKIEYTVPGQSTLENSTVPSLAIEFSSKLLTPLLIYSIVNTLVFAYAGDKSEDRYEGALDRIEETVEKVLFATIMEHTATSKTFPSFFVLGGEIISMSTIIDSVINNISSSPFIKFVGVGAIGDLFSPQELYRLKVDKYLKNTFPGDRSYSELKAAVPESTAFGGMTINRYKPRATFRL